MPGDVARAPQRRPLPFAQHRVDLDEMDVQRLEQRRQYANRAQRIRHHGAAAGAEFDQPQHRRRADRLPHRRRPQPEQFAEHLAHLGRRSEIALAPQGIARDVVAVLRMQQAQLHVAPDRHRSRRLDQFSDLAQQRRKFGAHVQP